MDMKGEGLAMTRPTDDMMVFRCQQVKDQWFFWCPFCRTEHWHSVGAGHRASHCMTSSPFWVGGYWLVGPRTRIKARRDMR